MRTTTRSARPQNADGRCGRRASTLLSSKHVLALSTYGKASSISSRPRPVLAEFLFIAGNRNAVLHRFEADVLAVIRQTAQLAADRVLEFRA